MPLLWQVRTYCHRSQKPRLVGHQETSQRCPYGELDCFGSLQISSRGGKRDAPGLSRPQRPVRKNLTISASSFRRQPCDHLVLPCTIVCNRISYITHAMNDISATGQAFIDILFAQLHGFRFIRLLQSRTLTVVDGRVVTLGPIIHFVTTQLSLEDESERIHTETLDLFPTKLG